MAAVVHKLPNSPRTFRKIWPPIDLSWDAVALVATAPLAMLAFVESNRIRGEADPLSMAALKAQKSDEIQFPISHLEGAACPLRVNDFRRCRIMLRLCDRLHG